MRAAILEPVLGHPVPDPSSTSGRTRRMSMSIISIEQQISELRLELAHCRLTRRERRAAIAELDWLKEQLRIDDEASYFAAIEREAEALPQASRFSIDQLPF
jgi:hypothetical protein